MTHNRGYGTKTLQARTEEAQISEKREIKTRLRKSPDTACQFNYSQEERFSQKDRPPKIFLHFPKGSSALIHQTQVLGIKFPSVHASWPFPWGQKGCQTPKHISYPPRSTTEPPCRGSLVWIPNKQMQQVPSNTVLSTVTSLQDW